MMLVGRGHGPDFPLLYHFFLCHNTYIHDILIKEVVI